LPPGSIQQEKLSMSADAVGRAVASAEFYITGGTMAGDAPSYVERQADTDLYRSLLQGEFCYLLNARQMGKSSLCVRAMRKLQNQGVHTAFLDLTRFGGANVTPEQWYAALLTKAGQDLGLRQQFLQFWKHNAGLPAVERFFGALSEVALTTLSGPVVVFVDEIDATRSLAFSTDEFFAALRACYVGRAEEAALSRLTFCLLGAATPADLIKDVTITPFNIGRRIEVQDFTEAEAAVLARGLGANGSELLSRVLYWTGGHPYLTQRLCRSAAENGAQTPSEVDRLCRELFLTHRARETDDNLMFVRNRLLKSEVDSAGLLELYQKVRDGRRVAYDETNPLCPVLRLSGVAKVGEGLLLPRNRIYARVFDKEWVRAHMPDAELRRQKAAYRRGLGRAAMASGIVLLAVGSLALYALNQSQRADRAAQEEGRQRRTAQEQAETNRRLLYAADMNLAQQAWETGDLGRAQELLARQQPRPGQADLRTWEWRYLWQHMRDQSRHTLHGYTYYVASVAFSHNGRLLATGSWDGAVRLWDVASWREAATLKGHTDRVLDVVFTPDDRTLLSSGRDSMVRFWDIAAHRLVKSRRVSTPGQLDMHVALSPDGRTMATTDQRATGGKERGAVRLWDLATGRQRAVLDHNPGWLRSVVFSPDGRTLATNDPDPSDRNNFTLAKVKLWDVATGRVTATLRSGSVPLAYSPDGRLLAASGRDNTLTLWDTMAHREYAVFHLPSDVWGAAFSPDSRKLAIVSSISSVVELWDVPARRRWASLRGHTMAVLSAAFSPDGKTLATGSGDQTVKIWSVVPRQEQSVLQGVLSDFAISPDSALLAASSADAVKVWKLPALQADRPFRAQKGEARWYSASSVLFFPGGRLLAACSARKTIGLWNVTTRQRVRTIPAEKGLVYCLAVSPDGKTLAAGTGGSSFEQPGMFLLWRLAEAQGPVTIQGCPGVVSSLAFSPDGRTIAAIGMERRVRLFDIVRRRQTGEFTGLKDDPTQAAFSPDGRVLAASCWEGAVRVWDVASGKNVATLSANSIPVFSLAFSPDGKTLAAGCQDSTVRLWNTETWRPTLTLRLTQTPQGHLAMVGSVAFSRDGSTLAAGCSDNTIRLWRAPSLTKIDAPSRR
jgi:WD40 repeat protein